MVMTSLCRRLVGLPHLCGPTHNLTRLTGHFSLKRWKILYIVRVCFLTQGVHWLSLLGPATAADEMRVECVIVHNADKSTPVLQDVKWSDFGFEGRDGRNSTVWIGTEGANTPCHQDSYGCNLVLQVQGRWAVVTACVNHLLPNKIDSIS